MAVDGVGLALEIDVGTAPLEGGDDVEDEWEVEVAVGVDIAPMAVFADTGKAFGELVGFLEDERDDKTAVEVDEAEPSVLLHEGQGVVVDVFHAFRGAVVVFEREDDAAEGVDDAAEVAFPYKGASLPEEANLIVFARDDLVALEVEESLFAVAGNPDATVGDMGDGIVDGFCEGMAGRLGVEIEEGEVEGVAGEEGAVVGEGDGLIDVGNDLVAEGVDDAPSVVEAHGGEAVDEGSRVLIDRGEELSAEGVDEGVEKEERVDNEAHGGTVLYEGAGISELDGNDDVALEVGIAEEAVLGDEDSAGGGEVDPMIDAGDDFSPGGVDETCKEWRLFAWGEGDGGVVDPYVAVAVVELVYVAVDVGGEDGAVFMAEAVEVALARGLYAFDIHNVAAAGGVNVVADFLRMEKGERRKEK